MAKKVEILNDSTGIKFGFGERSVIIGESMAIADAEMIQATYPGVYVQVVEMATENLAKSAKVA
ncbi:hypothetical protein [Spirosoma sp. 48-14]|uniref:hypothetical protein n=1 Tax=Spirosoma sp. 48-14 TaxID=1895854 RepID=UPI000962792D|nr:hypothetical protein [Spirosoma sp. 48-14]OJW76338.1 MAG: hypothetical protein BGO59_22730 [Spirosoma sp. 48-14]